MTWLQTYLLMGIALVTVEAWQVLIDLRRYSLGTLVKGSDARAAVEEYREGIQEIYSVAPPAVARVLIVFCWCCCGTLQVLTWPWDVFKKVRNNSWYTD